MSDPIRLRLVGIVVIGALLGLWPLGWLLGRIGRRMLGRDQLPIHFVRYVFAIGFAVFCIGSALAAAGLLLALESYHAFTQKTRVAEVQCLELGPKKLRVYFVGMDADGIRGPTEVYDVEGDEWTVGGDVLRFHPKLTLLGLQTIYNITRVEGRWLSATDAVQHRATAFDRSGGSRVRWLALMRDGTRGPLGWMIAGVYGEAVSQLPDRRSVYDIFVTPGGFTVEKRTL